ncbi:AcvB/VirJ family lysyl-phosphatidylglycerol hydrolase [Methylobacterium soli]|uniref:Virulence factor family protein n=1 Tax=Methylobacterium soli TaxID=553447 RepID=A0A6L3T8H5_9HYPH|nr:AcvB/VirJ family lysyl-phosphatidylglycerol hydrolase [Methylobacterium soli]KAB1079886.1 virulence factor family protein [Methylobacterium soli]
MIPGGGPPRIRPILALGAAAAAGLALLLASRPPAPTHIAAASPVRVSSAHFKDVPVAMPASAPIGLAMLVAGRSEPEGRDDALSRALLRRGLMVLHLDAQAWRAGLARDAGPCIRPMSDVEDLSKETQRALGASRYLHPVLVGTGEGGTLVHAILGQALAATVAGGVALDPADVLATGRPTCDGAPATPAEGGFRYDRRAPLQAPMVFVTGAAPEAPASGNPVAAPEAPAASDPVAGPEAPAASDPVAGPGSHRPETRVVPGAEARLERTVDAAAGLTAQDAGTGTLPLVDHPAVGPTRALAVFFSGDGGWRDIDKTIGEWLARQGVHVVGVDALRYFWSDKSPETVAADTTAIVRAADPGGRLPVLILGYSFGADVFPFAWPHLGRDLQERIGLVALLGPGRTTGFSVSVKGWLGLGGAHAVVPQIAAMPPAKVFCLYGSAETNPGCADASLSAVRRLRLEGGHHFDGDYPGIARRILEAARLPG